jgi:hypothetical protein
MASEIMSLAFTIGMSFAVWETEPASTGVRKGGVGTRAALVRLGTGVLAVAINLVANLGQS